jgi:hypothetical protein
VDKEVLVVAVQPSRPSVGSIVVLGLLVVFVVVSHFVVVVVAWPFVAVDNIAEGQSTVSSSSVLDWYLVECLIVVKVIWIDEPVIWILCVVVNWNSS